MARTPKKTPFRDLMRSGGEYALEWEAVTHPEVPRERPTAPRDDLGLTNADRAALGLRPVDATHLHGRSDEDARGVLDHVLP